MNNPFDYFDAIYCINLDERTDRWEHSLKQFEKLGISDRVERFSAIKCQDKKTRNELADLHYGGYWRPHYMYPLNGAVGCATSHLEIIKLAKSRGLKNVLVFEDDFISMTDWHETLKSALCDLDNFDWDLFYLGWGFRGGKKRLKRSCAEHLQFHRLHSRCRGVQQTHAIAYNSKIFDYLIEDINPFNKKKSRVRGHIDFYYRSNPKLKKYLANPSCFDQNRDELPSDNKK